MNGVQIASSFRASRVSMNRLAVDLIGRSYAEDDYVTVTVIGVCQGNDGRVIVKRRPGGTVSMPAWLIRAILRDEKKTRKNAA